MPAQNIGGQWALAGRSTPLPTKTRYVLGEGSSPQQNLHPTMATVISPDDVWCARDGDGGGP